MGKSISEKIIRKQWKLCLLSKYKAKFNENSWFEISVDAGDISNRGKPNVSLEGIRLCFIRKELKIINGKECLVPVEYEFKTLKDRVFLTENSKGEKHLDCSNCDAGLLESTLLALEDEGDSFSKENAEIEELIHCLISMLCSGVDRPLEEEEIVEIIKQFNEYDVKKELNDLLQEVACVYNCFINEKNVVLDRDERAEGIRTSDSFIKQLRVLCVKFWLNFELKIIEKHSIKDNIGSKKIAEFEEVFSKIERFIELREDYNDFSSREISRANKKRHAKDLQIIKNDFKNIQNSYKELNDYKESVIKGVGNTEEYNKKFKKIELDIRNCLVSLSNIEGNYPFVNVLAKLELNNKHDIKMGKYNNYKLTMDKQQYSDHYAFSGQVSIALKDFQSFTSKYDGIKALTSLNIIQTEDEKRGPYLEALIERNEFYQKHLKNSIYFAIENLENQNYIATSKLVILKQILDGEIETVKLFNSITQHLYIREGVFVNCSSEIKQTYETLYKSMKMMSEIYQEIQGEIERRSAKRANEKATELINCSNQGLKATLYDEFMSEKYASVLGDSTENAKADVLTKALKKYLSGSNFISSLTNPIEAFYGVEEMYETYVNEVTSIKLEEWRKKVIQVLAEVNVAMEGVVSTEETNEDVYKLMNDMLVELEGKGLSKEEALAFLGKLAEKVEEPKESGYYSDNDTEDTENSRFSAMNRR